MTRPCRRRENRPTCACLAGVEAETGASRTDASRTTHHPLLHHPPSKRKARQGAQRGAQEGMVVDDGIMHDMHERIMHHILCHASHLVICICLDQHILHHIPVYYHQHISSTNFQFKIWVYLLLPPKTDLGGKYRKLRSITKGPRG